jgi:hypothetical protein
MRFNDKRSAAPKAGDILPIVVKKTIRLAHPAQHPPKRGKLDYLGGPTKRPDGRSNGVRIERIEKKIWLQGRFVGGNGNVMAFVMLDTEDTA